MTKAGLRILVADDEADAANTLAVLLEAEGHSVRTANNGKHALDVVSEFEPDVVMLDIHMPELSGWEVARKIRDQNGQVRPMIIGISGEYRKDVDRILSEVLGCNFYVLKPYDFKVLLSLIEPLRVALATHRP